MAEDAENIKLAINGTLMRGLKLNLNMIAAGATFLREDRTEPAYRLWTINDDHPAMIRVSDGSGVSVEVEIWEVPPGGIASILIKEPPGLAIGKVRLEGGEMVLGVLGEPALIEHQREVSAYGGWRSYIGRQGSRP